MSSTTPPVARKRVRTWALATGLALSSVAMSACGSASGTGSDSSAASPSSSALAGEVAQLTKPLDALPVPTEPVGDISSLKGKTVYYIPLTQQAPEFAVAGKGLTAALTRAGLKIQICDGKGTPTDINACVVQATEAKAGAIVIDAVAYGMAANSLDAAQQAGIPIVSSDNIPDPDHPESKTLIYEAYDTGSLMDEALAKYVALDSGGKADLLVNVDTDGPSPMKYATDGATAFAAACPSCKRTTNQVSSANFSLVPSSTSAALLKDPNVNYVESQFAQFLQPTQTGIQQTSRTDIKVVTGAADLNTLKAVQDGSIAAAAAQAPAFTGWVDADAALRMMLGKTPPKYTIPIRLFTKDTMGDVTLTDADEQNAVWFGPAGFQDEFAKLWGVS